MMGDRDDELLKIKRDGMCRLICEENRRFLVKRGGFMV